MAQDRTVSARRSMRYRIVNGAIQDEAGGNIGTSLDLVARFRAGGYQNFQPTAIMVNADTTSGATTSRITGWLFDDESGVAKPFDIVPNQVQPLQFGRINVTGTTATDFIILGQN